MKRYGIDSLVLKDMGFAYGDETRVFSGFNYRFSQGEVLYLQGQQGTGKNTLIKLLLGMLAPTEGEYLINGTCVNQFSYTEFDSFRLNMGHCFDVGGLINNLTLYENFRLIMDYHGHLHSSERKDYIVGLLELFQLQHQMHLRPAFVSTSIRKAAAVLRAFTLNPELVILDNPTQGMNSDQVPALVKLVQDHQAWKGLKHVIISSEDLNLINRLNGKVLNITPTGLSERMNLRAS